VSSHLREAELLSRTGGGGGGHLVNVEATMYGMICSVQEHGLGNLHLECMT
jgi:hypothetical protein